MHLLLPTAVGTLSGLCSSSGLPGLTAEPKNEFRPGTARVELKLLTCVDLQAWALPFARPLQGHA